MDQRRISRRAVVAAAVGAACGLAAPALRAQPRLEKPRLTLSVSQKGLLSYLPLTIAEQLGFFRAEGLEVEIIEAASGAADVTCGPFEQVLQMQARGLPTQAFVLQARAPAMALGLSVRALPGASSIADLRGRRIGVPTLGSAGHLVATHALQRAGIGAGEVSFIGVGPALAAATALRGGAVDAICGGEPVMTLLEQRVEVKILADTRTLKGTQALFGGSMPAACLHAPQEFLVKHPNTCQALAHAMVHSLKWLQTAGPRDLLHTVPEAYLLGDRALYLASFEKLRETISPDGLFAADGARTMMRALAEFDPALRADRVDPARSFTNDFARRAKDRYNA